jgi:hypothetical protein
LGLAIDELKCRWNKVTQTILMFLLFSASVVARAQGQVQTFTSAEDTYQFTYPAYFVRCSAAPPYVDWRPEDCEAYIPVCPNSRNAANAACVAYPRVRYKEYRTFGAAAFSVAEMQEFKTEEDCLKVSDALSLPDKGKAQVLINGVSFKIFDQDGAAMNHDLDGAVYRTFHSGRCYELAARVTMTNAGVFDEPVRQLSRSGLKNLHQSLFQIAQSFRFLK